MGKGYLFETKNIKKENGNLIFLIIIFKYFFKQFLNINFILFLEK
jgi:hypothetical protein